MPLAAQGADLLRHHLVRLCCAGNQYFSVIFFSLISLMFDGFAEETLTVSNSQALSNHTSPAQNPPEPS